MTVVQLPTRFTIGGSEKTGRIEREGTEAMRA